MCVRDLQSSPLGQAKKMKTTQLSKRPQDRDHIITHFLNFPKDQKGYMRF